MLIKSVIGKVTKSISIIGPMGAGKTTVGLGLSRALGFDFIDMDKGTSADFIHTADGRLVLATEDRVLGEITERDFINALMDIWLGPKVRDKVFQRALMGQDQ